MEVPSLARGGDKQAIAALKPFYMTLREHCTVHGNRPGAAISSALPHLAQLQCQNYCLLGFTFTSSRASSRGITL